MAGLSQVVDMLSFGLFGFHIPYSVTIFTVNILMLIMAWKIVGRTFVIRTLFGVMVITTMFALFQPMFTKPPVEGQTFYGYYNRCSAMRARYRAGVYP